MSTPINSNTPVPPTGPLNPFGPQESPVKIRDAAFVSQQTVEIPPINAGVPLITFLSTLRTNEAEALLQDLLAKLQNATILSKMFQDAADQAIALRRFINQIYAYNRLQEEVINQDNIEGRETTINNAIDEYNLGVPNDIAQVAIMNQAIDDFNAAQTAYNTALQTYNSALATQQAAQTTYNTALQQYNTALEAYKNGTDPDPSHLQAAEATLQAAQADFNAAQANFAAEQANLNAAQTTYQAALANFDAAKAAFNAYAAVRNIDVQTVNAAITDWNTFAIAENIKIAKLNQTRAILVPPLPPIPLLPILNEVSLLPIIQDPGVDPLETQIQQNIDNYNASASGTNDLIDNTINPNIAFINGSGFTPPLAYPISAIFPISNLSQFPFSSTGVANIDTPVLLNEVNASVPAFVDVITLYLEPRLILLKLLKSSKDSADQFDDFNTNVNDTSQVKDLAGRQNVQGGVSAGVGFTTIGQKAVLASPFIGSILSKHLYESVINRFGVPAGSPLVDQLGAVTVKLLTQLGIVSAGPGNNIINLFTRGNMNGESIINVAVSLGFLKQVTGVTSSEFIPKNVEAILNGEPFFSKLSSEQKADLISLITGDITTALLQVALSDLSRTLELPGLAPQLLSNAAGVANSEALAPLGGQLYAQSALGQFLAEQAIMDQDLANAISKQAILSGLEEQGMNLNDAIASSAVAQLSAAGITLGPNAKELILQKIADIIHEVKIAFLEHKAFQREAFAIQIAKGLVQIQNVDESEARRIGNRIADKESSLDALKQTALNLLPRHGVTEAEAQTIVNAASNAYLNLEPSANPMSTVALARIASPAELASIFKTYLASALSPVVSNPKALSVAENYGNLIFTDPNGVLSTLETIRHERQEKLRKASDFDNEEYLQATKLYRDPGTFLASLTSPMKALLATSSVGGPSLQGVSFMDNNQGKTGHYQRPLDIPV